MKRLVLKFPDDIRILLTRRFNNQHRKWLAADCNEASWPMSISLGAPTEQAALQQPEHVRAWITAWQAWQGYGTLCWEERRWQSLGTQRLPISIVLQNSAEAAQWAGQSTRWQRARLRYLNFIERWPKLGIYLPRYFDVLADYEDADIQRLQDMLTWLQANPNSNLYPRQLPIAGINSKWLEGRKRLVTDLVTMLRGDDINIRRDFFECCGLKALPELIRLRVLDPVLGKVIGGLSDITAPLSDMAALNLPAKYVLIVENLQTGLALPDIPGAVVFMRLGYHVDIFAHIPWVTQAQCYYWGDIDTHGFAILHKARIYLPHIQSVLMDEATLLTHQPLWGNENEQHQATEFTRLTADEQAMYLSLKQQKWAHNLRLEQERIAWPYATKVLLENMS